MEEQLPKIDPERTEFARRMKGVEKSPEPRENIPEDWRKKTVAERLAAHKAAKERIEEITRWGDITKDDEMLLEKLKITIGLPLSLENEN